MTPRAGRGKRSAPFAFGVEQGNHTARYPTGLQISSQAPYLEM